MIKKTQNILKTKILQKIKINSSYILLINSLKKNNSEIEGEINNLNNNIDYLLYYNNKFSKKKKINKSKLIKEELEEQILNSNYNQDETNCLSYIISKIDKNGFLKINKTDLIKEIEYLYNINLSKKKIDDFINIIQQINKIGICTSGINDFIKYQIQQDFIKNKISENEKNILISISNNVKSANLNFPIQKFIKSDTFKTLNNKEKNKIITYFLNLKTYPITDSNIKQQETLENYKDNVDFFISTTNNTDLDIKIKEIKIPDNLITTLKNLENEINSTNKNDDKTKKYIEYIKKKYDFIKKYLDILNKRNENLLKIVTTIANKQKKYLITGDEKFLTPLKLKDISQKTQIPISTISRIVSNKRLQTDFGIIPLKHLFIKSASNKNKISTINLMLKIKDIISKNNNITDSQIVEILQKENINIARRTVNKYRNMLKINNSYIRKQINSDF